MNYFSKIYYTFVGILGFKKQTFTYFIPAPPSRKSGYREKNFDSIVKQLTEIGFKLLDIKTQSIGTEENKGMWVVLTIQPYTKEAFSMEPNQFPEEFINLVSEQGLKGPLNSKVAINSIELPDSDSDSDEVKGIYYID